MNFPYFSFIGRVLIGLPFAMSGLSKLAAYGSTTAIIAAAGLPLPPLAFVVAVAVELGGGLLLIVGYRGRPGIGHLLSGDCGFIPQQFRRSEPDVPLSKGRDDRRRTAPNRRLRAWSVQYRAMASEERNSFGSCVADR